MPGRQSTASKVVRRFAPGCIALPRTSAEVSSASACATFRPSTSSGWSTCTWKVPASVTWSATHDKQAVATALQNVSDKAREVLELRFFQDCSLEEIATTLAISLSAAKMRLYRSLDQFRNAYLQVVEIHPAASVRVPDTARRVLFCPGLPASTGPRRTHPHLSPFGAGAIFFWPKPPVLTTIRIMQGTYTGSVKRRVLA